MDEKKLKKLVQRLAIGRVDRGEEAAQRRRVLDNLHSAGIPTDDAAALAQDVLQSGAPHTLLAWGRDAEGSVDMYVIPDADLDDRMRNALDAINDLHFASPYDCSLYQYAAAMRVLAALGLESTDGKQFYEEHIPPVYEEMGTERDLEYLPGEDELVELFGSLRRYHVGRNGFRPGSLDVRPAHVIAVRQIALTWP